MMTIFSQVEFWIYSAVASGVMTWAAHNPTWHDPAIWLMGVIGHAIGIANAKSVSSGPPAP